MTEDILKLMLEYKSTLKKIEGGHSFSIVEFNHRNKKHNDVRSYASEISWLDLPSVYKSYHLSEDWENINIEEVPMLIVQRMQESWGFQKMFNSSKLSEFPSVESEILPIIDKMRNVLENLTDNLFECKELYLDIGGNDYWMIITSSRREVQVFEFMHFID